jgi:hypothetical protein
VVDGLRASFSRQTGELRGFRRATDRARRGGQGLTTVVMFLLVPQVKLTKRLDVARAAEHWSAQLGNLTGGAVTYSNKLEKIETIRDDGLIEGADPTIAALTGRIDVRFADTTLIDLAAGGMPVDLEFAYTLSVQAKLVLTAHEVYLPKPKLAVEGSGGVQASFDFRGAKKNTGAGRMLTVTLTKDLDGLVYG